MEKTNRKNLIISTDDFGKSELANRNILRLAEAGKLDRVSVMADGHFGKGDMERLAIAEVKLDIHLHLKNRLEDWEKIKEGFFKRGIIFLSNYLFGIFSRNKVEEEWERQFGEFERLAGKTPDGINSHRYDHFFPIYFPLAVKLAKSHKISRIRYGKIIQAGKNCLTSTILRFFWKRNKKIFLDSGLITYDYCVNIDWVKDAEKFLASPREYETELVCHPEREKEFELINQYF